MREWVERNWGRVEDKTEVTGTDLLHYMHLGCFRRRWAVRSLAVKFAGPDRKLTGSGE
jgi:hypothetical protein